MENLHEEFPLSDEELGCRHSTETLVGSDEEEGAHPGAIRKAKVFFFVRIIVGSTLEYEAL